MNLARFIASLFVTVVLLASNTANSDDRRYVSEGIFVSESTPPIRILVKEDFNYLGNASFILKDIANVDRHHWVLADDSEVKAMVIVQFEGLRDGVEGEYQFSIPEGADIAGSNFRFSPKRLYLGNDSYVHNTWAFDNGESIKNNPEAESTFTARLLAEHGHTMQDQLIMSRFVREVGPKHRDELILFYIEPLSNHDKALDQFPDGGPANEDFDRLSEEVTRRSLKVIQVVDDSP